MDIEKVNVINSVQPVDKRRAVKVSTSAESKLDSVNLTQDARSQAIYQKALKIVHATPEIRLDKIEEAKLRLESYTNPSNEVLDTVARKVLHDFTKLSEDNS